MKQKYDLTDIKDVITNAMDNPLMKIIRFDIIGTLGVVNPVVGIGENLLSEI